MTMLNKMPIIAPIKTKFVKGEITIRIINNSIESILKYFFPGSSSSFTVLFKKNPAINPRNAIIGSINIF